MASPTDLAFRPYELTDRDWVFSENTRHYRDAEGFDHTFPAAVEAVLDRIDAERDAPRHCFLIAERRGGRVGCVFLRATGPDSGRIHLLFLAESVRGRGLGRLMLERVLQRGGDAGLNSISVSTFDRHAAACRLYRGCGFTLVERRSVTMFGHSMDVLEFARSVG